eukprot:7795106-Ditylum_brightwellii.AAC.1
MVRVIIFFILAITKEGKTVVGIGIDEEGSIARSATFTNMIVDKFPGIRITTTRGYTSWMNGKVEIPHETLKNATRATLMDANKEEQYWCYTYVDLIRKYNVTYHSALKDYPDYA